MKKAKVLSFPITIQEREEIDWEVVDRDRAVTVTKMASRELARLDLDRMMAGYVGEVGDIEE